MNNLFTYLLELNISLVILFVAYKIFFEKDKNFIVRRIYLLGVIVLPFLLPLIPQAAKMSVSGIAPISIDLEGVTVFGSGVAQEVTSSISFGKVILMVYLLILALGMIKLLIQLANIIRAVRISERMEISGTSFLSNSKFHASSFFGYIFIDPDSIKKDSFAHILEHENIHKKEWHSIDRILVELLVMINWFNPVAWMFRTSVIQNLEYLADSAVLRKGTDPTKYQLSILNQYIGSASISNQFSSQIKNRINMLNKDYKLGSRWKLFLLVPLTSIAFFFVACTDKDTGPMVEEANESEMIIANSNSSDEFDGELFFIVEEMPFFGEEGDPIMNFRRYIAQNLMYPKEAVEQGVTGKIFIRFVVTETGEVVIPDAELMADVDQKPLDEVVVASYRTLEEDQEKPEQKYIDQLKEEVIRVISSSPKWTPGKQRGKAVNVMYTFPVTFALQ
ncbi:MAG: M56 family metallopeptidase [Bacteroidota bacterium]